MSEIKFGDFQKDERFKKLERELKLANVRKVHRKESVVNETWTDATCPSVSSINQDPFDSSATGVSLHTSRIGSEVVASSNNLRNILLKKHDYMSRKAITTSSVKHYNMSGNESDDRRIMPPPSFNTVSRACKSGIKTLGPAVSVPAPMANTDIPVASDIDIDSDRENNLSLKSVSPNFHKRGSRTFSNWRVALNAQGQLIIKGTLEDGRVARSKPVAHRLTSNTVQSIYKHVYQLRGTIMNVRNELPDYVRGKFFNGFPDDWRNVHQIWRSFAQEGCPVTFRWPTPISDSDDDLRSDITDTIFSNRQKNNANTMNSVFTEYSSNAPHIQKLKQSARPQSCKFSDSFTQIDISGTDGNVLFDTDEVLVDQDLCNKQNFNQNNVNHADSPSPINTLTDILKEDKYNVIINNLKERNYSREYINKINQMYECVNYLMSHNASANEQSIGTDITTEEPRCHVQKCTNGNTHDNTHDNLHDNSLVCYLSESIPPQRNMRCNNLTLDKENFPRTEKSNNEHSDESESETYTGIPKISVEKILRQRESLMRPFKHKLRKKTTHPDYQMHDDAKDRCNSHVPPAQTCAKSRLLKKQAPLLPDDSCVSITEDELGCSDARKVNHLGHQTTYTTQQSDTPKTRQGEGQDTFLRGMHEMQVHLTQENEQPRNKSHNNAYHSDLRGKISNDTNNKRCTKNTMIKSVVDRKPETYQRSEFLEMSEEHSTPSKGPSPTVISSVPVKMNLKGNTIESKNDRRSSEEPNIKSSLQKSSLSKNTSFETNINPTLAMSTDTPDHPAVQSSELSFNTRGQQIALDHSRNLRSRGNSNIKRLNDWTPKVVCISKMHCEFGLIFEGNLLNDADHVVHKKFVTDVVDRQISRRLFETKDHKTYQLVGELKDSKHVVPKELLSQCNSGCPAEIKKFCKLWVAAKIGNVSDFSKSSDDLCISGVDILNIPMSSKGRKIVPPLSYWTGERITLKGDQAVYNPGSSKDCSASPLRESFPQTRKRKSATNKGKNTSGQSKSDESKVTSSNTDEKIPSAKITTNNSPQSEDNQNGESASKYSRRAMRRFLSSSSSGDENSSKQRLSTIKKNSLTSTASPKKFSDQLVDRGVNLSRSTTNLSEQRERGNTDLNPLPVESPKLKNLRSLTRRHRERTCTLYQDVPFKDDTLSDDQVSQV